MAQSGSAPNNAEESKQVEAELNSLRDAFVENESAVHVVEERLSVVLMDEHPEKAGEAPHPPDEPLCELARQLRSVRRNIHEQTLRIRRMLNRLEL